MKRLLLAALIAGGLACDAVPPYRPCRRVPHKTGQMYKVSWKQIAAGGGAVGTVVAAYKVSDGVQQGMKRAAEKSPEHFIGLLGGLTLPFRLVLWCISLAGGAWFALKMYGKYHTRNRKGESER